MCCFLAVALVVVLVAVEQLYRLPLLHLVAVAVAAGAELNCGFPLSLLALLKPSLLALEVLAALPKHQTTAPETWVQMVQVHLLGLGRLLAVAAMVVAAQQLQDREALEAVDWGKVVQVQLNTAHLVVAETQQTEEPLVVEAIDPVAVVGLRDLQQV
jgi:hypothetical protein